MPDTPFTLGADGLPLPPALADAADAAGGPGIPGAPPQESVSPRRTARATYQAVPLHPQPAAPPSPAGKLNWIFGVLGIVTGLASFVWPLLFLTVLVSLALSAVGISRANRLRRRGANGRVVAIVGLVIGLASAANLVFGITELIGLGEVVNRLVP
jgi:hypothetical protein